MKKFFIILLVFITILAIILFLKVNRIIPTKTNTQNHSNITSQSSSTYSDEEIKALILKGKDNLNNMENVYYEIWYGNQFSNKLYYKGTKLKRELYSPLSPQEKIRILLIIDGKKYDIYYNPDGILISNANSREIDYGFQVVPIEQATSSVYEFSYLKDEKLDEKDCIVVKATYHGESNYMENSQERKGFETYWLEKSTGFVIGEGRFQPNEDKLTLETSYKNISLGTVQDSDFEIPAGYTVIK